MSEQHRKFACFHAGPFIVRDDLAEVECSICGQKLNAIWLIKRLLNLPYERERKIARLELAKKAIEGKSKARCEHCHRMTKINYKITENSIIDKMRENGVKI